MISECSLSSCQWTWDVRCVCSFVRMYPHTIVYFYIQIPKNLVNVGSSRHKLPRHQKNSFGDTDPSGQNWSDTVCRRRHVATCRRHFQLRLALVERIGMSKTARDSGLLDSEIVGVCPYQKGSSSVLILLSNGSYSSLAPPWISVLSGGTRRSLGNSRDFSPYLCAELASRCRRSFGELSPGGADCQVFAL